MIAADDRTVTFRAGGRAQSLPASAVREIVRLPRLTRVPNAPPSLIGLGNIRGAALPILSLAQLQGRPSAGGGRVLVLERTPALGLLVDDVSAVAAFDDGQADLDLDALLSQAFRAAAPMRVAVSRPVVVGSTAATAPARVEVQLIAFSVSGQAFALPVEQVEDVLAVPAEIVPLPRADPAVAGTIAHRGQLLPLLWLGRLLALPDISAAGRRIVVAKVRGRSIGLIVDAIEAVLRVADDAIDPVPAVIARRSSEARIQAIARLAGGRRLLSVLAADHLFDAAIMAQIEDAASGHQGGRNLADERAADETEPMLVFRIGEQSFGLPAGAVAEVVRVPDSLTRLPRAPAFIEGVMNLRGHALPIIDQRRRFGVAVPQEGRRRAIVVDLGTLRAGFIVDEVADVRRIARAAITPSPDVSADTRLFDRVATLDGDDRILLLIEPAELLDGAERDLLTALRGDAEAP